MSWAAKRKILYLTGFLIFFGILIGVPLAVFLYHPATCFDGVANQGETSPDHGGPCVLLDESAIQPHAVLWARSLIVRPGIYNAIAYVQNPNETAGVQLVRYHMGFYDDQNFLVAERDGITPIMPGGITPILEGNVDAGNRVISHTYFQFSEPLIWKRLKSIAASVAVTNIKVQDIETSPRISATVTNNSFDDITNLSFVATVFNTVGNAFAASGTHLDRLAAGEVVTITFTWPAPFAYDVNKLDIIPVHAPVEATIGKQ